MCACLDENPMMSRDTVKVEAPPENESYLDKLAREGNLDTFVSFIIFLITAVIVISILVCVLCYLSKKKPVRKQMSFDAYVYIDLAAKTEMRNTNMQKELVNVQKHGYQPKAKTNPLHG